MTKGQALVGASVRLYFLHIPKCGGTSVANALTACFDSAQIDPAGLWDDVSGLVLRGEFVRGHFGIAPLRELGPSSRAVTVLRDPAERTVSLFRHIRREPGHYFHQRVQGRRYNLGAFVRDRVCRPLIQDHQARYLSFVVDRVWLEANQRLAMAPLTPRQAAFELAPMPLRGEPLLHAALSTLSGLDLVGTTDCLDEFVARVATLVGGPPAPAVGRLNAATDDTIDVSLSSREERVLARLCQIDRTLFDEARRLADRTPASP